MQTFPKTQLSVKMVPKNTVLWDLNFDFPTKVSVLQPRQKNEENDVPKFYQQISLILIQNNTTSDPLNDFFFNLLSIHFSSPSEFQEEKNPVI